MYIDFVISKWTWKWTWCYELLSSTPSLFQSTVIKKRSWGALMLNSSAGCSCVNDQRLLRWLDLPLPRQPAPCDPWAINIWPSAVILQLNHGDHTHFSTKLSKCREQQYRQTARVTVSITTQGTFVTGERKKKKGMLEKEGVLWKSIILLRHIKCSV